MLHVFPSTWKSAVEISLHPRAIQISLSTDFKFACPPSIMVWIRAGAGIG
jgi:hypothetical protein